jgi:crotonobetainyl-CoA:carnitine CoA-transferase CaiB-like acyl-CoA transferase
VCGRTLAAHGADVLHVGAAHLPSVRQLVIDTGFGKHTTHLDLRSDVDRATLRDLVADADVFVQSFRPGTLAARGFGYTELAALRPGIVVVQLSAYGHAGPWRARRGFDSLVQMATGIADDGARAADADRPVPLPLQALDHAMGWLAAAAVCTALRRRTTEGGSWLARLSLARVAAWLDGLGRQPDGRPLEPADLDTAASPFGKLSYLPIPGSIPAAPPRYGHAPHLPGSDPAAWW